MTARRCRTGSCAYALFHLRSSIRLPKSFQVFI
jgi:hypothetical protein